MTIGRENRIPKTDFRWCHRILVFHADLFIFYSEGQVRLRDSDMKNLWRNPLQTLDESITFFA